MFVQRRTGLGWTGGTPDPEPEPVELELLYDSRPDRPLTAKVAWSVAAILATYLLLQGAERIGA